jgi:hypothetical protein
MHRSSMQSAKQVPLFLLQQLCNSYQLATTVAGHKLSQQHFKGPRSPGVTASDAILGPAHFDLSSWGADPTVQQQQQQPAATCLPTATSMRHRGVCASYSCCTQYRSSNQTSNSPPTQAAHIHLELQSCSGAAWVMQQRSEPQGCRLLRVNVVSGGQPHGLTGSLVL